MAAGDFNTFVIRVTFALISIEFAVAKVVFTNEPCESKETNIFSQVDSDPTKYKQCGPAGYFWLFPCSPGTTFNVIRQSCVISDQPSTELPVTTTTTTATTTRKSVYNQNSNDLSKNVQISENVNQHRGFSHEDYYEAYDEHTTTSATKRSAIELTTEKVKSTSTMASKIEKHSNQDLLSISLQNNRTKIDSSVEHNKLPVVHEYYKYQVSQVRRTPSSNGATTAKSKEYIGPQYNQNSQEAFYNSNPSHQQPHGSGNQKSPPKPLSAGAQELAKMISEEDLETLGRVFQMLSAQNGGAMPPGPPGGPIMMPGGFVPPLPEGGSGAPPSQPYNSFGGGPHPDDRMPHFYIMPPPMVPRSMTTEAPRLFNIETVCVENGTCSHDDMAETYCMHESDPVSYYQCSPGVDYGIWVVRQCPAGLHFNADGECGKKKPGPKNPPAPAAVPIAVAPQPAVSEQPAIYQQPYQPPAPRESSYENHNVETEYQTVTPESSFVGNVHNVETVEHAVYPQETISPKSPVYVKQPQPMGLPPINQMSLYPGIQQSNNPQQTGTNFNVPAQQVGSGPRTDPKQVSKLNQLINSLLAQSYQQQTSYPTNSGNLDSSVSHLPRGSQFPSENGREQVWPNSPVRMPMTPRLPGVNVLRPNLPLNSRVSNNQSPLLPKQPTGGRPILPKSVATAPMVRQSQLPVDFSSFGAPIRPKTPFVPTQPQTVVVQQANGQYFGGYPRYPDIPQLKVIGDGDTQSIRLNAPLAHNMAMAKLRPEAMKPSADKVIRVVDAKATFKDSPIDDSSANILLKGSQSDSLNGNWFDDLVAAKLNAIESALSKALSTKSAQKRLASSVYKPSPVILTSNNETSLKILQKTQERDTKTSFYGVDENVRQPFVGQRCSKASATKAVKFNERTFLVCLSAKKPVKGQSTNDDGVWVLAICPEKQMFNRLLKKCTRNSRPSH